MKAMESLRDLIEEAKLHSLSWTICILLVSYLLSPLRTLLTEIEFRRKARPAPQRRYLVHLQKQQVSMGDPILSTRPSMANNWKRKIDSPVVEVALDEFIGMVMKDFVMDLWYSLSDKEAPKLIRAVVKDVCGENAQIMKEFNLVDLLTRCAFVFMILSGILMLCKLRNDPYRIILSR